MKSVISNSRAETWLAAVQHLESCDGWEDYNLVLEVLAPMQREPGDRRIEELVDAFLQTKGCFGLETVAGTIFPAGEYRRHGARGVYEIYPEEIYPSIKSLPEVRWGTYAHRLVRRYTPKGVVNPLKICVEKMSKQLAGPSSKGARYELSLSDIGVDLPLYEPEFDRNHHIGGPCLSHVSLKITSERKLNLTALYRSHYYLQRVLGNLLGLARLQAFVCEQTGLDPGTLVCVSTYATLESRPKAWSKTDVRQLLGEVASDRGGCQKSPKQRRGSASRGSRKQ